MTLVENQQLAKQFEDNRLHLRAVAYRMLGSFSEADDAVQGTWLRLSRSDPDDIDNLGGWLTTAVARECLDLLRARHARREQPFETHIPDPVVTADDRVDPEYEAVLADSVGLALLVVIETLTPPERVAFVLHDVFGMPYDEIAPVVERSVEAARQLASRARRRVHGAVPAQDTDLIRQREVVDAFLAAARGGDLASLLEVLDPDVVLRVDAGSGLAMTKQVRGSETVAGQAISFSRRFNRYARRVLINGTPGVAAVRDGHALSVMGFTISQEKIVEIDILADRYRLSRLDLAHLP